MVRDGEVIRETEADPLPRPKECVAVAGVVRMLVGTLEREGGNECRRGRGAAVAIMDVLLFIQKPLRGIEE